MLQGGLRIAWFIGVAVFAVQFVLLLQHSWYLWAHFDLTADFGQYSQAWQQIATGHLNPYDTTYAWYYPHYGYPFYQADLELIMWPLALLYWVWPHAIDLLVVQDAALAGAGLVAFRWVLEHLGLHAPNRRFAIVVAGAVAPSWCSNHGPTGPRPTTTTPSPWRPSSSCWPAVTSGATAGAAGSGSPSRSRAATLPRRTWSPWGSPPSSAAGDGGAPASS